MSQHRYTPVKQESEVDEEGAFLDEQDQAGFDMPVDDKPLFSTRKARFIFVILLVSVVFAFIHFPFKSNDTVSKHPKKPPVPIQDDQSDDAMYKESEKPFTPSTINEPLNVRVQDDDDEFDEDPDDDGDDSFESIDDDESYESNDDDGTVVVELSSTVAVASAASTTGVETTLGTIEESAPTTAGTTTQEATTTALSSTSTTIAASTTEATSSSATNPANYSTPMIVGYGPGRKDRAGSVIMHFLFQHYYAFHMGWEFGGDCGGMDNHNRDDAIKILEFVGLDQEFPFACPDDWTSPYVRVIDADDAKHYFREVKRLDPAWVTGLLQTMKTRSIELRGSHNPWRPIEDPDMYHVAVHIRRGDVAPCSEAGGKFLPDGRGRYISNVFYFESIKRIIREKDEAGDNRTVKVRIYSEGDYLYPENPDRIQYEPLEEFEDHGYELKIGGSITDVWDAILRADAVVVSNSAFSLIPSFFKFGQGQVRYFQQIFNDLPHQRGWKRANTKVIRDSLDAVLAIRHEHCPQDEALNEGED